MGILQARRLEWVATPLSSRSSQPRDWTWVFHIAGRFYHLSQYFPANLQMLVLWLSPHPNSRFVPPTVEVSGNLGQNNPGGIFDFSFYYSPHRIHQHLDAPSKYIQNLMPSHFLPATTMAPATSSVAGSLQWPRQRTSFARQPISHTVLFKYHSDHTTFLQTLQGLPISKCQKCFEVLCDMRLSPPHTLFISLISSQVEGLFIYLKALCFLFCILSPQTICLIYFSIEYTVFPILKFIKEKFKIHY